jgi:hypothetical protein
MDCEINHAKVVHSVRYDHLFGCYLLAHFPIARGRISRSDHPGGLLFPPPPLIRYAPPRCRLPISIGAGMMRALCRSAAVSESCRQRAALTGAVLPGDSAHARGDVWSWRSRVLPSLCRERGGCGDVRISARPLGGEPVRRDHRCAFRLLSRAAEKGNLPDLFWKAVCLH